MYEWTYLCILFVLSPSHYCVCFGVYIYLIFIYSYLFCFIYLLTVQIILGIAREDSPSSPILSGSLLADELVDEVSEFCLTFESDSTISEPDLSLVTENRDSSFRNSRIVMDLGRNGHVPTGFVDDKRNGEPAAGGDGRSEEDMTEGRRVSLDDLRTSVIKDIDSSDVVVTRAVVSLS